MDWTTQITINDFKRGLSLPLDNQDKEDLNDYIQEVVESTMLDMLGEDEYADFVSEYEGEDPADKWTNLWDGVEYTDEYGNMTFAGAKKSCIYFIYAAYLDEMGIPQRQGRYNSVLSNTDAWDAISNNNSVNVKYNKGITIYQEAYNLFQSDLDTYSNIKFTDKQARWLM